MTADSPTSSDFPPPLGAVLMEGGVHFSVFSRHATALDLCLYASRDPARETARLPMVRGERDVWHLFVPGAKAGLLYGYRAHGPWQPKNAHRFNPNKLLLDPYARAIAGEPKETIAMSGPEGPLVAPGTLDSGPAMLKSVVVDGGFNWKDDRQLRIPWRDTVLYEAHVKGLTQLNPHVPRHLRGTYAGLAHEATITYLRDLGVTSLQLLPVHQHLNDRFLLEKDLTNYWGYNTIGFFAPHNEYAAARDPEGQVLEFKKMVRDLHDAGIEVILDVVYNHTAEGSERGPTLLLRGFDDRLYYRHAFSETSAGYLNVTGTGNAIDSSAPPALALILDSLRYWVTEMHVDGFRFDLAVTVARDHQDRFSVMSQFMAAIGQDPILSRVKLIAEAWDIMREDSYQIGAFPEPWRELNGKYRDTVRRFWAGEEGTTAEFAKRICGSQDIYGWNRRPPLSSINFLTSHDGFTLNDVVSYASKHNEANGEENRDGDNQNHSMSCGVEGPTTDARVLSLRARLRRSFLATMMTSVGVPFITAGDERGRTQKGNNNAYCQDNEISWVDWHATPADAELLEFTRRLTHLRRTTPALRRTRFFDGRLNPASGLQDVTWLSGSGALLTHEEWHKPEQAIFGALLDGAPPIHRQDETRPLLIIYNRGELSQPFVLPQGQRVRWMLRFDTSLSPSFAEPDRHLFSGGAVYSLRGHSVALFILRDGACLSRTCVSPAEESK
ncbi:MAG TPA: glycogen debranching protein GlgX [Prosthecobacter sp.]|nr:glycogen debranching protein GlgX [Prosthecobacter sp.]